MEMGSMTTIFIHFFFVSKLKSKASSQVFSYNDLGNWGDFDNLSRRTLTFWKVDCWKKIAEISQSVKINEYHRSTPIKYKSIYILKLYTNTNIGNYVFDGNDVFKFSGFQITRNSYLSQMIWLAKISKPKKIKFYPLMT